MFGKASPSISPSRVPSSQPGANETIVVVLVDEVEVDVVGARVVDEVEDDVELLVLELVVVLDVVELDVLELDVVLVLDEVVVVEPPPGMPTHAPSWQ